MKYEDYIARREQRSPRFRDLREANQPVYEFQAALIRARLNAGLTQRDLAEQIEVPQSAVARWENGTNIPTLETLQKLAPALNVDFRITKHGVTVEPPESVPA